MSKYVAEYEVGTYTLDIDVSYSDRWNCNCDSICRCTEITNVCVNPIKFSLMDYIKVYELPSAPRQRKKEAKLSDIQSYCIDRLMHIHGCYDPSNYETRVSQGYYGQEVSGVTFNNTSALIRDVIKIMDMSGVIEPVQYVLELEYATLEGLSKVKSAEIKTISTSEVIRMFPSFGRIKRNEDLSGMVEFDLPLAVMIDDEVVDGFRRLKSAVTAKKEYVKIIALYTKKAPF